MAMEGFNPSNKEYKKVEDLPKEEQSKFVDVPEAEGGGFVLKTVMEREGRAAKEAEDVNEMNKTILGVNELPDNEKETKESILHETALDEDHDRDNRDNPSARMPVDRLQ